MRTSVLLLLAGAVLAQPLPEREVVFSADYSPGSEPLPLFDNGYLSFIKHRGTVSVYDRAGKLLHRTAIRVPGATQVSVGDVAVAPDGTAAVTAAYGTGRGYSAGLVLLDRSGASIRFFETGPYVPVHVCFAPDGAVWTAGWQRDGDREDSADHAVIRKFTREGKLTGSFLPRSLFPKGLAPGRGAIGRWYIRSSRDRIGVFCNAGTDQAIQWIEMDFDGNLKGRWFVPMKGAGNASLSFAFTPAGELLAFGSPAEGRWNLMRFDRNLSSWREIDGDYGRGILLGAEGDQVVLLQASAPALRWFRAPQP